MGNHQLLISSIICGLILFIFYLYHSKTKFNKTKLLTPFVFAVVITSILNHGHSNPHFKILDRVTVVISVLVFTFILLIQKKYNKYIYIGFIFVFLGAILFFLSKIFTNCQIIFHCGSHIISLLAILYLVTLDIYLLL